ncbi:MAG: gamma-glutamyl-gamma-aminobutyrate hydrolase family protein [Lachnospiraceae bacterium]|nr:gamma-glutamyl-gamma-aminobutyrate hydrolase family protein [Lachnospiraceae bacterium]
MKTVGIIGDRTTFRRNHNYYDAAEACGVKTVPLMKGTWRDSMGIIDGIIIPGGGDLNPALYGEQNHGSVDIDDELDELETAVLDHAVKAHLPVFGICRGFQLINVYFGGSLIQHIDDHRHHVWIDRDTDNAHDAVADQGSFIYGLYGKKTIRVNSAHHQAVKKTGTDLIPVLYSDDGLIEAFVHSSLPIIGVQFHPERMCLKNRRADTVNGLKLFEYFTNEPLTPSRGSVSGESFSKCKKEQCRKKRHHKPDYRGYAGL